MSATHVVKQGEHMSGIAAQHGFTDFLTVWNHAENAAIRALRDPTILFPGDKIFIPDKVTKTEQAATDRLHRFQVGLTRLFLRLKLHDVDDKGIAGAPCELGLESDQPSQKTTDANGFVFEELGKQVQNGEALVHKKRKPAKKGDPETIEDIKYDLKIGHLNPKDKLSGQQARLNNLGYFAGFTPDDITQFQWAVEEFQCDHIKKGGRVKVKPEIEPESDDPSKETGIVETGNATRNKLESVHGC